MEVTIQTFSEARMLLAKRIMDDFTLNARAYGITYTPPSFHSKLVADPKSKHGTNAITVNQYTGNLHPIQVAKLKDFLSEVNREIKEKDQITLVETPSEPTP